MNLNYCDMTPEGGISKSEYTFIATQRLGEHIPTAKNT
jgi:hypothetical protein